MKHPDGYIQLKDRSKDIIISGGENISSIEVEDALYKHPAVLAAAVVAMPDEKWGETPCAFVELKPDQSVTRGGHRRLVPAAPRLLQMPAHGDLHRTAEDLHRQDPEVPAARDGTCPATVPTEMAGTTQRPFHTGLRFSMKASMPSAASSAIMLQAMTWPA